MFQRPSVVVAGVCVAAARMQMYRFVLLLELTKLLVRFVAAPYVAVSCALTASAGVMEMAH